MLLHANYTLNPVSLHISCKSFIQNQSVLPRYPSLFLTILKARATEATRSTLRHLESANSTLLHTKWLPCPDIRYERGLSIKNTFNRIKHKKREVSRIFSALKPRKIPILSSNSKNTFTLMVITTDQLLWRHKNYFRGAVTRLLYTHSLCTLCGSQSLPQSRLLASSANLLIGSGSISYSYVILSIS